MYACFWRIKNKQTTKIRKEKQTHVRGVVGMHAFGVYTHTHTHKSSSISLACTRRKGKHVFGVYTVVGMHAFGVYTKKGENIRLACTHKKSGKHVFGVYAKKKRKK